MTKQGVLCVVVLFLLGGCTSDRSFQPGGAHQLPVPEAPKVQQVQPAAERAEQTGWQMADEVAAAPTVNHPPEITRVGFVPDVFMPTDRLGISVHGEDADGDELTFTIAWTVNGQSAGEGTHCTVPLKRGDKVSVRITPHDGTEDGHAIVLDREIINFPPQIQADEGSSFDGTVFHYRVKATDPDGDQLRYFLQTAPPEMTIEPTTGQIEWIVPEDFAGVAPVSILVEDGHGGKATYEVNVKIRQESASL